MSNNSIKFLQGSRYSETAETCPSCHSSLLFVDKMQSNEATQVYVCMKCGFMERRKVK